MHQPGDSGLVATFRYRVAPQQVCVATGELVSAASLMFTSCLCGALLAHCQSVSLADGARWRFPLRLVVCEPNVDDVITITGDRLGQPAAVEFPLFRFALTLTHSHTHTHTHTLSLSLTLSLSHAYNAALMSRAR